MFFRRPFCKAFLFKQQKQLPASSTKPGRALGAWRTRLPKGSCPLFGRCRGAGKDIPSLEGGLVKSALPPGMGCCLQPEWVSRVACLFWVLELWNYARSASRGVCLYKCLLGRRNELCHSFSGLYKVPWPLSICERPLACGAQLT